MRELAVFAERNGELNVAIGTMQAKIVERLAAKRTKKDPHLMSRDISNKVIVEKKRLRRWRRPTRHQAKEQDEEGESEGSGGQQENQGEDQDEKEEQEEEQNEEEEQGEEEQGGEDLGKEEQAEEQDQEDEQYTSTTGKKTLFRRRPKVKGLRRGPQNEKAMTRILVLRNGGSLASVFRCKTWM